MWDWLRLWYWRIAASGVIPARWYLPQLPDRDARAARRGELHIEIVSHCWNYSHLLVYQLSSLALHPPAQARITMTVYYAPEDKKTAALLEHFATISPPRVSWQWRPLPRNQLFRRGIGRHQAAVTTRADWIWFTDCDLVFGPGCLDLLNQQLQGRQDALLYPREERVTTLLSADDERLLVGQDGSLRDIDPADFAARPISRATGPLQITHGDVARAAGYCGMLKLYQQPAERFAKCHEDRAFRWLLRSQGEPIDLPGVCRIRHAEKGRYKQGGDAWLRGQVRKWRERLARRG